VAVTTTFGPNRSGWDPADHALQSDCGLGGVVNVTVTVSPSSARPVVPLPFAMTSDPPIGFDVVTCDEGDDGPLEPTELVATTVNE
jgi:hypothetical protein